MENDEFGLMAYLNANTLMGIPTDVPAVDNTYAIDLKNEFYKVVNIETLDAVAKAITVSNIPTVCTLVIDLDYTNAAAVTWFENIVWKAGSAPVLIAGQNELYPFYTKDGGATWRSLEW